MKQFATYFFGGLTIFMSFLVTTLPAQASDCAIDLYNHNGSVMEVYFCDAGINIAYDKPRSGIRKHGVSSGTILFEGSAAYNGKISGTAKVFKSGCGSLSYPVSGRQKGNRIVLHGRAPVRNSSCGVKRYRKDRLVFTLINQ